MRFKCLVAHGGITSAIGLLGSIVAWGCGGIEPVTPTAPVEDGSLYAAVVSNYYTVTLSTAVPYDTVQLVATPVDLTGAIIAGLPAPFFFAPDTTLISVTADGFVRAKGVGSNIPVIARLVLPGNQAHNDTTFVTVTNLTSPPKIASISGEPLGDSAQVGMGLTWDPGDNIAADFRTDITNSGVRYDFNLPFYDMALGRTVDFFGVNGTITVLDSSGNAVNGLAVGFRALDPLVATVVPSTLRLRMTAGDLYTLDPFRPGRPRFELRTRAYNITITDTTVWKLTPPPFSTVYYIPRIDGTPALVPDQIKIRTHGVVAWWSWMTDTTTVVFDDPTNVETPSPETCLAFTDGVGIWYGSGEHCGMGNVVLPARIGTFPDPSYTPIYQALWYEQIRQFPVAGTYRYHETLTGKAGVIIVSDE